eukprot:gene6632-33764_t
MSVVAYVRHGAASVGAAVQLRAAPRPPDQTVCDTNSSPSNPITQHGVGPGAA